MQEQLQQHLSSVATQQRRRADPRKMVKKTKKLEFSKQLTMIDICCWAIVTLVLLLVMLVQPSLAGYCVNIFNAATAAYVSLRLGYTAKAGVENYKKISATYKQIMDDDYFYEEGNG